MIESPQTGGKLILSLSMVLKGAASKWLVQVLRPDLTWEEFKKQESTFKPTLKKQEKKDESAANCPADERVGICQVNPMGELIHNGERISYQFDSGSECSLL